MTLVLPIALLDLLHLLHRCDQFSRAADRIDRPGYMVIRNSL